MDSQDYETNRNLTLMFFLEKLLVEKGSSTDNTNQPHTRSLHDLSCQFGTRGFSKEMRQIAGGSQAGLKKFLLQYPSLFTINGEQVSITQSSRLCGNGSVGGGSNGHDGVIGSRDYNQEAIEYFKNRLKAYGPGTEVPIKSLLGHRSQAPPEVRHISGQHAKEFKDFLCKFPDEFVIKEEEDIIYLKEYENQIRHQLQEGQNVQPSSAINGKLAGSGSMASNIDPRVTAKLLSVAREELEKCSNLTSDIDHIFKQTEAYFRNNDESSKNLSNGDNSKSDKLVFPFKRSQDLDTFLKMHSHLFKVQSGFVTLVPIKNHYGSNHPSPSVTMATSAPKAFASMKSSLSNEDLQVESVNSRMINSGPQSLGSNTNSLLNKTLKQRVNSVVLKALADNSDRERRGGGRGEELNNNNNNNKAYGSIVANGNNNCNNNSQAPKVNTEISIEKAKEHILQVTRIVMNARESAQICHSILCKKEPISVDAEGINLGTKGQMTLLQISTMEKQTYIFDLLVDSNIWIEGRLKEVLECPDIIKVFHDCRNDSGVLNSQHGILLQNIFDTQAAHAVLELQDHGKPVYKVKNVSLNALCDYYGASINPIKDQVKAVYRRDQRFWARRPLTIDMICYAAADVISLVPNIYEAMKSAMKPEFLNLFRELCEEQVMLYVDPEGVKAKKKQRKIDFEVSDLRLKLANTMGKNVVLSNREIRLLRHVELTDDDKERLKGSYKVAKKLEKLENKQKSGSQNGNDDSDDDSDREDQELPSLESVASDGSSELSLVLNSPNVRSPIHGNGENGGHLSSLRSPNQPSSLTQLQSPPLTLTESMDMVNKILADSTLERTERIDRLESLLTDMTEAFSNSSNSTVSRENNNHKKLCDASTQTVSTGDINITKVYSEANQQQKNVFITSNSCSNNLTK